MLVLTRKLHDSILVEVPGKSPIVIKIVRIDRNEVRIGIEAEKEVRILRDNAKTQLA